ncbi:MAG: M28 family peptidase [Planctomycetes bacterium]|nr:M28 family peptidase [Planctomycetota bacterium]
MPPIPHPSRPFSALASRLLPLWAATLCALPLAAQTALPDDRSAGAAAVTLAHCQEWLGTLASPEFEGRGTGQQGYRKAAEFVAAHFERLGLEARGDNGTYFQHVPWSEAKVVAERTFVEFTAADGTQVRVPAARLAGSVSASTSAAGDAVLLVLAVPAPTGDGPAAAPPVAALDGVDLDGKVVLAYVRSEANARSAAMARFAVLQALQGKNTAAVLFVQRDEVREGLRGRRGAARRANPAAAGARRSPLDATFGGADLDALLRLSRQEPAVLDGATAVLALGLQAKVEVAIDDTAAPAMNVFAVLPGSDPQLREEYVVVGSHLDHLGRRGDTIYPGADDDASGTTGVMAVAQMLARNPVPPRRSVLFVCFAGEESGLVGSAFFVENCPIPLASIVAELQMDMIGRDEEENVEGNKGEKAEDNRNSLHLVGTQKLAPALHQLCLAANERARFDLEWDEERMFGRSDHANFAQRGVPVAFFFTGLHRDYHRPTDTADRIHYAKLLRVARFVYDIAFELASQPGRPEIEPGLWRAYRGRRGGEPAAPLRPEAKDAEGAGVSEPPPARRDGAAPGADRGSR